MTFRRVFVYYHRGVQTGGPEALHQLVSTLRDLGVDAALVPLPGSSGAPRHPSYDHYECPEVSEAEDAADCAILVPEAAYSVLKKVKNATKFCWWLSIDFSEHFFSERQLDTLATTRGINDLKRFKHRVLKPIWTVRRKFVDYESVVHLTQSRYASSFLLARLGITSAMLSDFTALNEFATDEDESEDRGRTIAYNYAKGGHWVEQVAKECPDIAFLPIRKMSRHQVISALSSCSVYLDMGHHPGKDRLPREAALAGAVTIVASRGAGAYWDDVPIPDEHKVSMTRPVENAVLAVREVLSDLPGARAKQQQYIDRIQGEQAHFRSEARSVFFGSSSADGE